MVVIKRDKSQSAKDLIKALEEFIYHLQGQKEFEAIADLQLAIKDMEKYEASSTEFTAACDLVRQAFGDKHELEVYAQPRKNQDESNWTDADQLFMSSTRVTNLLKRF